MDAINVQKSVKKKSETLNGTLEILNFLSIVVPTQWTIYYSTLSQVKKKRSEYIERGDLGNLSRTYRIPFRNANHRR